MTRELKSYIYFLSDQGYKHVTHAELVMVGPRKLMVGTSSIRPVSGYITGTIAKVYNNCSCDQASFFSLSDIHEHLQVLEGALVGIYVTWLVITTQVDSYISFQFCNVCLCNQVQRDFK